MGKIKDFYIEELQEMSNQKEVHINLPSSYNELTNWQIKMIMKAINSNMKDKRLYLFLFIILYLNDLSILHPIKSIKKLYNFFKILNNVPLSDDVFKSAFAFIFKLDDLTTFPKHIKHKFCRLYGPTNRLANLTAEEYSFADLFYYQWIKTKDAAALNRLVSVLYRPKSDKPTDKDVRKDFVKEAMPNIAQCVQKIDMNTKTAIGYAFGGSRLVIEKQFAFVFPKRKKQQKTTADNYVFFDTIVRNFARSENQPLGDLYRTRKSNIYDFLAIFNDEIKHQKELERHAK